jgi:hypothetical protein
LDAKRKNTLFRPAAFFSIDLSGLIGVWPVAEYLEASRPVKTPTLTLPDLPNG